jgi:hypothetical protein
MQLFQYGRLIKRSLVFHLTRHSRWRRPRQVSLEEPNTFLNDNVHRCHTTDPAFVVSMSGGEQIAHACRILSDQHKPPIPFAVIGRCFGITQNNVKCHMKEWQSHADAPRELGGQPSICTRDQIADIVKYARDSRNRHQPATLGDLRPFAHGKLANDVGQEREGDDEGGRNCE